VDENAHGRKLPPNPSPLPGTLTLLCRQRAAWSGALARARVARSPSRNAHGAARSAIVTAVDGAPLTCVLTRASGKSRGHIGPALLLSGTPIPWCYSRDTSRRSHESLHVDFGGCLNGVCSLGTNLNNRQHSANRPDPSRAGTARHLGELPRLLVRLVQATR
jgi:hypothetical protein